MRENCRWLREIEESCVHLTAYGVQPRYPMEVELTKIHFLNEFISIYRLLKLQENENKLVLDSSKVAGEYFASLLGGIKDREKFMAAFLDTGNNIIETRIFSEGTEQRELTADQTNEEELER